MIVLFGVFILNKLIFMRTFLSLPFILLLYWTPPSLNNAALDKWCKTLSMGMRSHPITCECDGLNPPPHVSGSCALPVHNRLTLFPDRNALCQRVCVRASHSADTRSVCHPQSNTLKINSTHEQTHKKNIWFLKQAVANCCLGGSWMTPDLPTSAGRVSSV